MKRRYTVHVTHDGNKIEIDICSRGKCALHVQGSTSMSKKDEEEGVEMTRWWLDWLSFVGLFGSIGWI